jgi:hypothetical protein
VHISQDILWSFFIFETHLNFMTFQKKRGTRYQKCRRLYDILHTECFTYDSRRTELLIKLFDETNNRAAAEMIYSYQNSEDTKMLREILSPLQSVIIIPCSIPVSYVDMVRLFTLAKLGNLSQLVQLMRGIAVSCAGITYPWKTQPRFESINLSKYRMELGEVLINTTDMDWGFKTLLHFAITAKSETTSRNGRMTKL